MITRITGTLRDLDLDQATVAVDAFDYQVLIPDFVRRQLQGMRGKSVSLHTIQYLEGNPAQGRLTPRLVGFLTEVERAFFELFCSVDGVGVRKALRAMVRPVKEVAIMIEEQDPKGLSTLPGIGPATADRVIAKLRRKMPRFALMVDDGSESRSEDQQDVVAETFEVLCKLGHHESEARQLIDTALEGKQKFKDVESLLDAVYRQNR